MDSEKRISLNGVEVYPFISDEELVEYVDRQKGILVAINAEKILHATQQLKEIVNRNIGYCDGVATVIALKRKGYKNVVRIPGCELWLKIVGELYKKQKTFYLVGGKQEVIENTVIKLKQEFQGIQILGYRNGYIQTVEERQKLINDIVDQQPDVVFVAMGSPKQELLMEEMHKRHSAIYQGLGGSFDVYTGVVKRAPLWWREHGLEWAYRLIKQPARIKRQFHLLRFLWLLEIGKL